MEAEGRLGKLAKELQRVGITREQLLAEIQQTYRRSQHPPTPEEAFDLARAFVDWLTCRQYAVRMSRSRAEMG
jgi:hypothetical protein